MNICQRPLRALLIPLAFLAASGIAHANLENNTADVEVLGPIADAQFGGSLSVTGDFNGDGLADLVVGMPGYSNGASNEGAVYVYYGTVDGYPSTPDYTYETNTVYGFVGSSPIAADINGDGYDDLVVGAYNYSEATNYKGAIMVFFGGPDGLSTRPDQIVEGESSYSFFGALVRRMGDLNGDGYEDVAVSASGQSSVGKIYIYFGSATGLNTTPAATLSGSEMYGYYGNRMITGDVDGDGLYDLIVSTVVSGSDPARITIYKGTANGIDTTPIETLGQVAGSSSDLFGDNMLLPGDIDGDGYPDLVVGSPYYNGGSGNSGMMTIFYGSASGFLASGRIQTVTAHSTDWSFFGGNLASGDFDNDGYADVVVGTSVYSNPISSGQPWPGIVWILRGTADGLETTPMAVLKGQTGSLDQLGTSLAVSDINHDGVPDLFAGSSTYSDTLSYQGILRTYYGVGINHAPVAAKDKFKLEENARLIEVAVLDNDTDVDGDTLTVTKIVALPVNGTATLVAGHVFYKPDRGYVGSDSFSYKISDGRGGTDKAKVKVTVSAP